MSGRTVTPTAELPPTGKLLRRVRGRHNVTQAADRIGRSPTWWSRRELGQRAISIEDLRDIAAAYGCKFSIGPSGLKIDTPAR